MLSMERTNPDLLIIGLWYRSNVVTFSQYVLLCNK